MLLGSDALALSLPRLPWASPAAASRSFEDVALVHLDALYQMALRLTGNRAEAEDLVQDAYVRAFRNFPRFEPGTNCRAWLCTILRRLFLNSLPRRGRERLAADPDSNFTPAEASATAPAGADPEVEFFRRASCADVDRAVRELPLVFREAVMLVDLEEWSYREAAAALGCPIGTVMSRLSRGRRLLRHTLRHLVVTESCEAMGESIERTGPETA